MILNEELFEDFYDYGTAAVSGSDVVDRNTTGFSFYTDFLSNNPAKKEYLRKSKNLVGEVVMMSPSEYFKLCSEYGYPDRHPSVEQLKTERRADKGVIKHLKDVLTVAKKKFPMPYINKAEMAQEGLHRMLVIGDMFGWDHKVPVLVVDHADKELAAKQAHQKVINQIESKIRAAIRSTLQYKFTNESELREQLQWELDRELEYNDNVRKPVEFELVDCGEEFCVHVGEAEWSFSKDDIKFVEPKNDIEDELDFEDLFDPEEHEAFLRQYFGDDWRETHPHLQSTFKRVK